MKTILNYVSNIIKSENFSTGEIWYNVTIVTRQTFPQWLKRVKKHGFNFDVAFKLYTKYAVNKQITVKVSTLNHSKFAKYGITKDAINEYMSNCLYTTLEQGRISHCSDIIG